MPDLSNAVDLTLERKIVPKMRVGIQIAVIAAGLLIFFAPKFGLLSRVVPGRLLWILSAVGLALLAIAVVVVAYLPAYYRKISRMVREQQPRLMRVTVKDDVMSGYALAELRPHEADETAPVEMVVRVIQKVDVPDNYPAEVYSKGGDGPVVIKTVNGTLWPAPDEKQQKLEELFRVNT